MAPSHGRCQPFLVVLLVDDDAGGGTGRPTRWRYIMINSTVRMETAMPPKTTPMITPREAERCGAGEILADAVDELREPASSEIVGVML